MYLHNGMFYHAMDLYYPRVRKQNVVTKCDSQRDRLGGCREGGAREGGTPMRNKLSENLNLSPKLLQPGRGSRFFTSKKYH